MKKSVLFLLFTFLTHSVGCPKKPTLLSLDIYVAQASAGGNTGANCANARALSSLVAGDWAASNNIHLCGTLTSVVTAQGSGSAGSPITIIGEAASQSSSSVWSISTGAIDIHGRSYINVQNVTILNTGNSTAGTQTNSTGIYATGTDHVTIHDSSIYNIYVRAQGDSTTGVNKDQLSCVDISGTNWRIYNNTFHDVGWCVHNFFGASETGEVDHNEFYNMDHALTTATSAAVTGTSVSFHDNKVHDMANWDGVAPYPAGCAFHHDGVHAYTTNAGAALTTLTMYNNKYYGNWGNCPTGFLFDEGTGGGTPSRVATINVFNEVGIPGAGSIANTSGWFQAFYASTAAFFYNNTALLPGTTDLSTCFNIGSTNNTTIKGNLCTGGGGRTNYGNFTGTTTIDYNQYDTKADGGNNCWIWNSAFVGCSFATWKTTLSGAGVVGADSHARQDAYPLALNADASPQSTYTGIKWGDNLGASATGNLASMASDSSSGGTRTPVARPATASCTSQGSLPCWDIGAMQYTTGGTPGGPGGFQISFTAVPLPATGAQPSLSAISPKQTYVTSSGCSQDGIKFNNPCIFSINCTACDSKTTIKMDSVSVNQTYASGVMTVSVPIAILPVPTANTVHVFSAANSTNVPILQSAGRKGKR